MCLIFFDPDFTLEVLLHSWESVVEINLKKEFQKKYLLCNLVAQGVTKLLDVKSWGIREIKHFGFEPTFN